MRLKIKNPIKINGFKNVETAYNSKNINKLAIIYKSADSQDKFEIGCELYRRYKKIGDISTSIHILEELRHLKNDVKFINRELRINLDKKELLNDNIYLWNHVKAGDVQKVTKVLHVLNTSIPYVSNGYSIRSKYIIENQRENGIEPVVITRPGFPNDFNDGLIQSEQNLVHELINGITYYRCLPKLFIRHTPLKSYLQEYIMQISKIIEVETPDVLHSASNYVNGLAGLKAARNKSIPFFYEIRGFWELTTVVKEPLFNNSEEFRLAQKLENYVACQADQIITISHGLRKKLIDKGINPEKITIIPNGVDCKLFKPMEFNQKLGSRHNLNNNFIIGYVGSITKYEGLQTLLSVIAKLKVDGYKIKYIIIGDGDFRTTLERLVNRFNLGEDVIFVGRIPHDQVIEYYSLFDLCVYPRINEEVTRVVTPLKPLEAMACGKPVIGSALEAIKEIIIPGINGLIFDNSEADLCRKIKLLYEYTDFRNSLKHDARKWVVDNRDWKKLASIYQYVYQKRKK